MNNFIVEEYLITVKGEGYYSHYAIRKYDNNKIEVLKDIKNSIKEVELENVKDLKEKELIKKYITKIQSARLKYATSYLYLLLSRKIEVNLKDFGDLEEVESFKTNTRCYKVCRHYFNAKGKMFEKMFKDI